jgi:uncharacterized membrane protein YdcZ (DUF606 family)
MMRSFALLLPCLLLVSTMAFAPLHRSNVGRQSSHQHMMLPTPLPVVVSMEVPMQLSMPTHQQQHQQPLSQGIHNYLGSSTQTLSLVERKIPTAEEIAEKKRNFNLWFWGGGVVAPFLATFYYFGFKFWER